MLTTQHIIEKLIELKPQLSKEYGVKRIGIFGSFSEGNYSKSSDIDLLVKFEPL